MRVLFADTFYYLAILSAGDSAHDRAAKLSETLTDGTLTTAWVLTEVADALSLTDCVSFVAMKENGVTEALPGDRHSEQAGFIALLK